MTEHTHRRHHLQAPLPRADLAAAVMAIETVRDLLKELEAKAS